MINSCLERNGYEGCFVIGAFALEDSIYTIFQKLGKIVTLRTIMVLFRRGCGPTKADEIPNVIQEKEHTVMDQKSTWLSIRGRTKE